MTLRPLEPSVERFVAAYIPSVLHLESLLYLRARSDQEVSVEVLARSMYVDASVAARVLADLAGHRLVAEPSTGAFTFRPATPELRAGVEELAEAYRERLVPLHDLIHERASASSIHEFANAFRIRKD